MCATGRCVEGVHYTNDDAGDDRFHNSLRLHSDVAMRNAYKVKKRGFLDRHEGCEVCAYIRSEGL